MIGGVIHFQLRQAEAGIVHSREDADDAWESSAAEETLRALCSEALPRFKQPRRYLFVSELPYTATGKVQRFKLREQLRAQRAAS